MESVRHKYLLNAENLDNSSARMMFKVEGVVAEEQLRVIAQMVIAFLAGALIGLEREKARSTGPIEVKEATPPGVRSFGFVSLIAALSVVASSIARVKVQALTPILAVLLPVSIGLLPVLIISLYTLYKLLIMREAGITTPLALSVAYAVGALIGMGLIVEATAVSVFTTFMLAIKLRIEKIVRVMTYEELLSALQIGIVVFLVGPLFSENVYDPIIGVINFRSLYVFFVIILVLSYLGYLLVKVVGPKAISLFSLFGGLIHSEATVVNLVRIGEKLKLESSTISAGVVAASTSMVLRNLVLVLGLTATLHVEELVLTESLSYIIAGFLPPIIIGYFLMRLLHVSVKREVEISTNKGFIKPISYGLALKALLVFTIILVATTYLTLAMGSYGTLASSALGGLVSSEAVIFTVYTLLSAGRVSVEIAVSSSLIATSIALLNKLLFLKAAGAGKSTLQKSLLSLSLMSTPILVISYLTL